MMFIDPDNPVVRLCSDSIAAELDGRLQEASALYQQAWEARKEARDASIAAHYLARVQTTAEDSLFWNAESLRSADAFGAETPASFYPSLYLNTGKSYEEMGNRQEAGKYYELARVRLHDLEQGRLSEIVKQGIEADLRRVRGEDSPGN